MKIIITENKKKEAIYKYFDKVKAKGELPSIEPFLSFFEVGFWDSFIVIQLCKIINFKDKYYYFVNKFL